jgi:hypothetical protein
MSGVEILNEYVVASQWSFHYWWALGFLVLALIIGAVVSIYEKQAPLMILFLGLGVVMGTVAGGVAGAVAPLEQHQTTRYEVIVDDTVSMNEFYEKYKIISQEGKIYTVEEKE